MMAWKGTGFVVFVVVVDDSLRSWCVVCGVFIVKFLVIKVRERETYGSSRRCCLRLL